LLQQGRFGEAEQKARAELARAEASSGADSLAAARVLDLLVQSMVGGGKTNNPETTALVERALTIKESRLGADDPEVAGTLTVAGRLHFFAGDFPRARALCAKALAIREKALAADHIDLAAPLDCLGMATLQLGDAAAAQPLFERAVAIQEKALGPADPDLAPALNHLGIACAFQGNYEKAFPILLRSIAIQEKKYGPDDANLGSPLNNLGKLYTLAGDFAEAAAVMERTLKLRMKTLGPEHYEVGVLLDNLANLHMQLADYDAAEDYYRQALAVVEKSVGLSHVEAGSILASQGDLLMEEGRFAEAVPLLTRGLEIQQKAIGENAQTALVMIHLASAQRDVGRLDQAGPLFDKALAIQDKDKTLGPDHPDRATGLFEHGSFLLASGDFAGARDELARALAIREKVFGSDGPEVSETHRRLAAAQWGLGNIQTAMQEALHGEASIRRHLLKTSPALSERQALLYESRLGRCIAMAASILAAQPETARKGEDIRGLWDEVVRSRAVVLDEMARRHRNVLTLEDAKTAQLSDDLARARARLSHVALAGLNEQHPEDYHAELDRRQAQVETLERELAGASQAYRSEEAARLAGFKDALAALPKEGALAGYLRFDRIDAPRRRARAGPGGIGAATPWYAVLTARSGGAPALTLLRPVAEIDPLVAAWRKEVMRAGSSPEEELAYAAAASQLTKKLWDPIAARLQGARLAFLVPDGTLSLLNFGTLALPGNRFLVEAGPTLHYLSAERDLLRPARRDGSAGVALVLGGPDFDRRGTDASTTAQTKTAAVKVAASRPTDTNASATPTVYRGPVSSCESFRSLRFDPLPGTMAEATEVSRLLETSRGTGEVVKLTGQEASEQAFKKLAPGKAVLHVATHGFFLPADCRASPENPLLLSGLALSGANERMGGAGGTAEEDGILTSEEVASLDLRAAGWVVLSACETGAGVIKAGEGVLGLRRAFQIAGAQTLIMSLWSVADVPAQEWIRNLYASRLAGASSAEAVRAATLKMIAARRQAKVTVHPHAWGAFIATGDWR